MMKLIILFLFIPVLALSSQWENLPLQEKATLTFINKGQFERCPAEQKLADDSLTGAVQTLNLLAYGGVDQMKYQPGGKPGGEAVELDDSDWRIT